MSYDFTAETLKSALTAEEEMGHIRILGKELTALKQ